jgi:hypothetical protein
MSGLNGQQVTEVLVGSAKIRVAPKGTVLPTLDGTSPIVWAAAWKLVGYTEDGVELGYSPNFKDIMVDEEMSPVQTILTEEKGTISAKLAQTTIDHIALAVSASIRAVHVAAVVGPPAKKGYDRLTVGSGVPVEMVVGLEGISPEGFERVVLGYRALATGNMSLGFKKNDKLIVPMEFRLLADGSKPVGARMFEIVDFTTA